MERDKWLLLLKLIRYWDLISRQCIISGINSVRVISLDGVYDGSANVYSPDGYGDELLKPSAGKQLALGVSGRAEYVMPYFTVGIGLGTNVIHAGGDLKSFYQILALKIEVTRNSSFISDIIYRISMIPTI